MPDAPTIDTALIPGVRRLWSPTFFAGSTVTVTGVSPLFPARSIIRTFLCYADASGEDLALIDFELAFGNTLGPASADFLGTGRILPDVGRVGLTQGYHPDPQTGPINLPVNWLLPNRTLRLLVRITNNSPANMNLTLRLVIDSPIRIGDQHVGG